MQYNRFAPWTTCCVHSLNECFGLSDLIGADRSSFSGQFVLWQFLLYPTFSLRPWRVKNTLYCTVLGNTFIWIWVHSELSCSAPLQYLTGYSELSCSALLQYLTGYSELSCSTLLQYLTGYSELSCSAALQYLTVSTIICLSSPLIILWTSLFLWQLTKGQCQIVNLGAGYDTTYWNLKDEGLAPTNFIEVDFEGVTSKKSYYIKHRKPLLDRLSAEGKFGVEKMLCARDTCSSSWVQISCGLLSMAVPLLPAVWFSLVMHQRTGFMANLYLYSSSWSRTYFAGSEVHYNKSDLHSSSYHIIAADLRNLPTLQQQLASCAVDMSLPTMFITECVLVYMTSESSSALLKWIAENFHTAFFANYEQVFTVYAIRSYSHVTNPSSRLCDRIRGLVSYQGDICVVICSTRVCSLVTERFCLTEASHARRTPVLLWKTTTRVPSISMTQFVSQRPLHRCRSILPSICFLKVQQVHCTIIGQHVCVSL